MSAVASMTGFASVQGFSDRTGYTITLKSVNHRILDLVVRVPRGMEAIETELRGLVKHYLRRGHVELTVTVDIPGTATPMRLDRDLLMNYAELWRQAAEMLSSTCEPSVRELLRMPGVTAPDSTQLRQPSSELQTALYAATAEALMALAKARFAEGRALAQELDAAAARLAALVNAVTSLSETAAEAQRARLQQRVAEVLGHEADPSRMLLEAALLAERGDIDEELVRLRTHVARLQDLVKGGGEVGRPLDFLLQELNREANTLLSKAGNCGGEAGLSMTDLGLKMKLEIERAREQVQNLE